MVFFARSKSSVGLINDLLTALSDYITLRVTAGYSCALVANIVSCFGLIFPLYWNFSHISAFWPTPGFDCTLDTCLADARALKRVYIELFLVCTWTPVICGFMKMKGCIHSCMCVFVCVCEQFP